MPINQPAATKPYEVEFATTKQTFLQRYGLVLYLLTVIPYLIFRTTVVNWHNVLGPIIYLVEVFNIFSSGLFLIITRQVRTPVHRATDLSDYNVDIFITTYNEALDIVEPVILGATKVRGVQNIYILDDAARPEMAEMAKLYRVKYISRHTNTNAKAGNLNNALPHSKADFIMELDADHIPLPNFLDRTMGFFDDPKVGFVQTPQTFYNIDSFLFRKRFGYKSQPGKLWSEQGMFYHTIQPAKNGWNAAFFVGTGAVLRRTALDSIGGYATGTTTEDLHTSLRLHAKGWGSVFLPEVLAYGLEAENYTEYYKQRKRWATGSLSLLFRSADSPLRAKSLSAGQRANYLSATTAHLQGAQKLAFFLLPLYCVFTLQSPVSINFAYYNLIFVLHLIVTLGLTIIYSRGTYHILYNEAYNFASIPAHLGGLWGIANIRTKFAVSNKSKLRRNNSFSRALIFSFVALAGLGLAQTIILLYSGNHSTLIIIGGLFNGINLLALLTFVTGLARYERGHNVNDRPNDPEELYHWVMAMSNETQLALKTKRSPAELSESTHLQKV